MDAALVALVLDAGVLKPPLQLVELTLLGEVDLEPAQSLAFRRRGRSALAGPGVESDVMVIAIKAACGPRRCINWKPTQ